jgi:hypothetical protein
MTVLAKASRKLLHSVHISQTKKKKKKKKKKSFKKYINSMEHRSFEKLIVVLLVKKHLCLYVERRLISVITINRLLKENF